MSASFEPDTPITRRTWRLVIWLGAFALAILIAQLVGRSLFVSSGGISTFWPTGGLTLAALLLVSYAIWPLVIGILFFVQMLSAWFFFDLAVGPSILEILPPALESVISASISRKVLGRTTKLCETKSFYVFAGVAVFGVPALGAFVGAAVGEPFFSDLPYWYAWQTWWLADALGVLLVATPILVWSNFRKGLPQRFRAIHTRPVETVLWFVGLAALSLVVFGWNHLDHAAVIEFPYTVLPMFIWAAIRFDVRIVSLGLCLMGSIAIGCFLTGGGHFLSPSMTDGEKVMSLQVFLVVTSIVSIVLANLVEQNRGDQIRLAEVVRIAPEAIIAIDSDMRIQLFNESAERTFGYKAGEVIGRSLEMLIPEELRAEHRSHVEKFRASSKTFRVMDSRGDIVGKKKDGTVFPAAASVSKLEVQGEAAYTVMLHDITERRLSEGLMRHQEAKIRDLGKKLFRVERTNSLGMMLAAIVHELNQPLAALKIYTQRLIQQSDDWDGAPEAVIETLAEIDRLARTSNEVMQRVRRRAQPEETPVVPLVCEDALHEVLLLLSREIEAAGIELDFRAGAAGYEVMADPIEFELVILNLVRNAIDAHTGAKQRTEAQGPPRISIRLEEAADDNVRICIADNGPGFSVGFHENLFEPFFTTKEKGWGMGLAICRQFAEDMGGKLTAGNNRPNGLVMNLVLPLATHEETDA